MNIPIDSPLAYIGFLLAAVGGFMVLAGFDVITIQQVSVRKGTRTWVIGLILAIAGLALLIPELLPASTRAPGEVPTVYDAGPAQTGAGGTAAGTSDSQGGAAAGSTGVPAQLGADWQSVTVELPTGSLWSREGEREYRAVGAADTIAWSAESFQGDVEFEVDISSSSELGEANVILYGDGGALAPGCLIFSVANDYQKIMADTVYETGRFLGDSNRAVAFGNQAAPHTLGVRVVGGTATLSLDGADIISAQLGSGVNAAGRIGLYKYAARPDVTFSNARVRAGGSGTP